MGQTSEEFEKNSWIVKVKISEKTGYWKKSTFGIVVFFLKAHTKVIKLANFQKCIWAFRLTPFVDNKNTKLGRYKKVVFPIDEFLIFGKNVSK